jgi:hypothetical protein
MIKRPVHITLGALRIRVQQVHLVILGCRKHSDGATLILARASYVSAIRRTEDRPGFGDKRSNAGPADQILILSSLHLPIKYKPSGEYVRQHSFGAPTMVRMHEPSDINLISIELADLL